MAEAFVVSRWYSGAKDQVVAVLVLLYRCCCGQICLGRDVALFGGCF